MWNKDDRGNWTIRFGKVKVTLFPETDGGGTPYRVDGERTVEGVAWVRGALDDGGPKERAEALHSAIAEYDRFLKNRERDWEDRIFKASQAQAMEEKGVWKLLVYGT